MGYINDFKINVSNIASISNFLMLLNSDIGKKTYLIFKL